MTMNHRFKIAGVLLSWFFGHKHETNRESSNNPNYKDAGGSEQSDPSSSSDGFSSSSADSGSSRLTGASLPSEVDNLNTSPIIDLSKLSRFPFRDSSYTKGESSHSLSSASSSHVTTKEMAHQTLNCATVEMPPPQHTEPSQIRSETLGDKEVAIKMLTIGCAMVVALLTFHKSTNMNLAMRLSMVPLLIGIVALLIGFFLHKEYPDFSDKSKLIGFAGIFIGLFGIVGAFLGFSFLSLFPALCAIAVVILLVFVFVKKL